MIRSNIADNVMRHEGEKMDKFLEAFCQKIEKFGAFWRAVVQIELARNVSVFGCPPADRNMRETRSERCNQ